MSTINVGRSASAQLTAGAAILAAARTADTRFIKDRLAAFERVQQRYSEADAKVQKVEADLANARALFHTEQQDVVDALARALVADGQPIKKPFAAFGAATMSTLVRMAPADAVTGLSELLAAIRRSRTLGKPMLQAVQSAEKVTRDMEHALARIEVLNSATRDARSTRVAIAQTWETEFGALKRGARAAADDGATTLYATLFDRPARPNGKNHKSPPIPAPTTVPAANPASATASAQS